jgi:peptide/nickel transport system substrate-binding protein
VPDAATQVPSLANGGIARDGLRITYHLRPGIRWSDGKPLTARDCVFTWRAIMNPRTNVPDRYGYYKISSVTAPDDRTVVVRLRRPFSAIVSTFLTMNSNYPILPEHNLGSLADLNHADVERPIIGSGPFTLVEWKHGDHLTFAANPTYFRGRPAIAKLVMRFVPAVSTIVDELRTGEIDGALELTDPNLIPQIRAIPGKRAVVTPSSGFITMYFNLQSGLTKDGRVREAISDAIDSHGIIARATNGIFSSTGALRGEFGHDALPNAIHADTAAAKAVLDADGWTVGPAGVRVKNGRPLGVTIVYSSGSPVSTAIALQLRQELADVGIDLNLHSYTPAMLSAPASAGGPIFGGHFDVAIVGIYQDAGPYAAAFFVCSERRPVGFNLTGVCDPQIDTLFTDILTSSDPSQRDTDVRAIEQRLFVDRPQVPLMQLRTISAVPDGLHGFNPVAETPWVGLWKWHLQP